MTEVRQKKVGNIHTFTFEEAHLAYHYKDPKGEGDFEVAYSEIPEKHSVVIQSNDWLRNVGLLWCAIGALQIVIAFGNDRSLVGSSFWALIGLTCLAAHHFRTIRYSVFKTSEGNIFVIQGKDHDEVVGEMQKRRRQQLLKFYGEVNPENDPEREVAKFKWLEKQRVLTPEEAAGKISQIKGRPGPRNDSALNLEN